MKKDLFTGAVPSIPLINSTLICPVVSCGFICCHFQDTRTGKASCGTFIEIDMWCEQGHSWTYHFEFSHGSVELSILNAKDCDLRDVKEMWRN